MAVNNGAADPNKKNAAGSTNGNAAPGNTPSNTPSASGVSTPASGAENPSHNATIYDNPNTKFTDAEWEAILGMYNISDPEHYNDLYTFGGLTQDINESIAHGGTTTPEHYNGTDGWYRYDGADRPDYSNDADATFLNGVGYYITTQNKDEWHRLEKLKKEAMARGDTAEVARLQAKQDNLHIINEKIRAGAGYSGGVDGSMYYVFPDENSGRDIERGDPNAKGNSGSGLSDPSSELRGMLDAWQQAALQQSNGQIDYAVAKAVADLERALQDAQPQFKEQAETVAREERQALDNSALYAEMRGDKGGIGQEQYNSIQNTAAQNHLAVQQAQTKLATDTQRQIADLRAQGEFEKADAALQITQQYLQQLIGLEQWAKEYNLSVDQFNEQIRQWEMEYNMAMQQLQISQNQWQAEFNAAQSQWQQQFDYGKQSDMANIGWALLEAGVPLSQEQMDAMGIDANQASQILLQSQLEAALKQNGGGTGSSNMSPSEIYQALYDAGFTDQQESSVKVYLQNLGIKNYKDYAEAYVNDQYKNLYNKANAVGGWGDGYSTSQKFQNNGQPVASEWEMIKSNIRTMLNNGDFAGVTQYIDQLDKAGRWTETQWNEIRAMLDNHGYFN